jgi:hypothetical protein
MSDQDKHDNSYKVEIKANDISGQIAIGNGISQNQGSGSLFKEANKLPEMKNAGQIDANLLRKILVEYFNDGELRDICFELDVAYESLPGMGKRDKARELVAECQRKGKMVQLTSICTRERPHATLHSPKTIPQAR